MFHVHKSMTLILNLGEAVVKRTWKERILVNQFFNCKDLKRISFSTIFISSVCNTPAILSFDPFPNYGSSNDDSSTRFKRDVFDDIEDETFENQKTIEEDAINLKKIREQVDEVLQKVCIQIEI